MHLLQKYEYLSNYYDRKDLHQEYFLSSWNENLTSNSLVELEPVIIFLSSNDKKDCLWR